MEQDTLISNFVYVCLNFVYREIVYELFLSIAIRHQSMSQGTDLSNTKYKIICPKQNKKFVLLV